MNTIKTLEQLKVEYIDIVGQIMELGHGDVLIELNKSIKRVNWKVDKLSKDAVIELNKFDGEISKIKTSIFNTTNETINNMKEGLTSKIRNINNNMNVSLDELKDSVDIEISDQEDRMNSIDKKLEELEKYLDNINCEQVEINNNLEHHEKKLEHIENYLTDNMVVDSASNAFDIERSYTSYEGLQELKKIKAEFDNLNTKSNNERSK